MTAPTVPACTITELMPDSTRRIALMPMAALASSPVERSAKNRVGSLSSRSQTAGWRVASTRPSTRRMAVFCISMNAVETTVVATIASAVWTIRLFSAFGTYSPSTRPVAIGTSAPRPTATSPPSSRARRSAPVPRRQKPSNRRADRGSSGNGW